MTRKYLASAFFILVSLLAVADEGLWIPALLDKQIFTKMQNGGLQLPANAIYSETNPSIKDAIVLFGGNCSAGIVSDNGLLITNYHCAVRYILPLNTDNYSITKHGFWAKTKTEEIPIKDLTAEVLVSAKEVTNIILLNVPNTLNEKERLIRIKKNCIQLEQDAVKGTNYKASVESFFAGNQYFLFVKKIYTDIRMVGVPPESLNFGQNTDNWQWPRHSADFAFFRIYADRNNNPASYSENNRPFEPSYHLKISAQGIKQGDFTMVLGYPANTTEYLPAEAIREIENKILPVSSELLQIKKNAIESFTYSNEELRIKKSGEYAVANNDILKNNGYLSGFKRYTIYANKVKQEKAIASKDSNFEILLNEIKRIYAKKDEIDVSMKLYTDGLLSLECIKFAIRFKKLADAPNEETFIQLCEKTKQQSRSFFDLFDKQIDSSSSVGIFREFQQKCKEAYQYPLFKSKTKESDLNAFFQNVCKNSWLLDSAKVFKFLNEKRYNKRSRISSDLLYCEAISIYSYGLNYMIPIQTLFQERTDSLHRQYVSYLLKYKTKELYPDANYSMRIAYGSVRPYSNADAVSFSFQSTHHGLLEKQILNTPLRDYTLDSTMNSLFNEAKFGKRANSDGDLPICFIANNHTSAANSGSPVLNANGLMIGLNMDRTFDGTINDYYYDIEHCRNISVDVRYILYLLENYAHANVILHDLDIIE